MDFQNLVPALPSKRGAVYTLENGASVARSYFQLHQDIISARDLLFRWGVKRGMRVGIYAPNSYHWLVYDLALLNIGAVSVAFTDDFQGRLNEATLETYGVSLLLLSKNARHSFPKDCKHIAFLDAPSPNARVLERSFLRHGDEDDHLSLVFSSGSSGRLKGLVISRMGTCATLPPIMDAIGVHKRDRLLLFLPLSNFQQRFLCYAALQYDFDLIITDHAALFSALKRLHPTILLAPPVFYQMLYGEYARHSSVKRRCRDILAGIASFLPSAPLRRHIARLLFQDVYQQFGHSIRLLITGMAPIRRDIGLFFARAQLPLCEAYGMVEAGVMAFRDPGSREFGSVGKPLRDVHFRIETDGELIVSRPFPLTLRYFQCAEGENERTFLSSNSIATGDIGKFDADGNLFIMGRKGEAIVTSSGHKIHPEIIEREINNCPEIANSVVFQRENATHLSCVVSLNVPASEEVRQRVQKFIQGTQGAKKIARFVEVIFADAGFSRENGMLRPNMKIDRRSVVARWSGPESPRAAGQGPKREPATSSGY